MNDLTNPITAPDKPTPGPWKWDVTDIDQPVLRNNNNCTVLDFSTNDDYFAIPNFRNTPDESCDVLASFFWFVTDRKKGINHPDARLIESAPLLYKILEEISSDHVYENNDINCHFCQSESGQCRDDCVINKIDSILNYIDKGATS